MALNLSIKGRLLVLSSLAVVAVAVVVTLFFISNRLNQLALAELFERDSQSLVRMQRIDNTLLEVRFRAAGVLLDQLPVPGSLNHLRESRKLLGELWRTLEPGAASMFDTGETLENFKQIKDRWSVVDSTLAKLDKGYSDKDNKALTTVLEDEWPVMVKGVVKPLQTLIPLAQKGSEETYKQALKDSQRMLMVGMAVAALCLLVLLVTAWLTVRSILGPLDEVKQSLRAIADGDFSHPVPPSRADELGAMMNALRDMQNALSRLVHQVRQGTDTIATASSQIAAGNMDLSSRTEQQASSLEETAASMEELTSTVKQNADNARQANQLAVSASGVAVKGGHVVSQVVNTMSAINTSSKKIVDIIGVIDGIAFQTNILALNAAVEAARAGEQGRGFAVVAAEVRNLAQRSAAAAKEIKTLIGDSVDKVEEGSKQVAEAGKTMDEIVGSVKRVTDIMAEITAASQEQTQGIEQINQAITQMDQVTQQNAALVEQAAAAAASLQEQATGLSQVVSVFKLDSQQVSQQFSHQINYVAPAQRSTPVAKGTPRQPPAAKQAIAAPQRRPALADKPRQLAAAGQAGDWEEF